MIITVCNFKGGVGKTTTCHALATAKGIQGKKVLMVDLDAQHSLSTSCDVDISNLIENNQPTICELLIAELENVGYSLEDIEECIIKLKNVDILPCNKLLSDVNDFLTKTDNFFTLKNVLDKVKTYYDYIFIDCSPTNNILTKNALISSDSVIIPVESYFLGSEGLYDFIENLEILNKKFETNIIIEGIILTMFQNTKICNSIREYVKNSIGGKSKQNFEVPSNIQEKHIKVFKDVIPRSIKVAEAGLYGQSIIEYKPKNAVSQAYWNIANEI